MGQFGRLLVNSGISDGQRRHEAIVTVPHPLCSIENTSSFAFFGLERHVVHLGCGHTEDAIR